MYKLIANFRSLSQPFPFSWLEHLRGVSCFAAERVQQIIVCAMVIDRRKKDVKICDPQTQGEGESSSSTFTEILLFLIMKY